MRKREIQKLVNDTADPAFVVNGFKNIEFLNEAAEEFFGISAEDAIGQECMSIVQGSDECGEFCSKNCTVFDAAKNHHPIRNFDLKVVTEQGRKWCNVSILIADEDSSVLPYTIHIIRNIDLRKRLELLVRNFVVTETDCPPDKAIDLIASTRAPSRETPLSERESQVLRLLAKGKTTKEIAKTLFISPTTVNNHVQHILKKLNAHTRLEAVRRAEIAGLI